MQTKRRGRRSLLLGILIGATMLLAGALVARDAAAFDERGRHGRIGHGHHAHKTGSLREARRLDHRLDRRGEVIDFHYDMFAFMAAIAGEYALADALDRRGDRLERYYDRRGDRILRRARAHAHRHHRGCGHGHLRAHRRPHHHGHGPPPHARRPHRRSTRY